MFTLDPGTVEAFAEAVSSGFVGLMPIIAIYIALPIVFYVGYRIKNMFPRS